MIAFKKSLSAITATFLLGLTSNAQAQNEDIQGLWSGGYGFGGSQFTSQANLDIANGYGELTIKVSMSKRFLEDLRSGRVQLPDGNSYVLPGEGWDATSYSCKYYVKREGAEISLAIALQQSGPACDNRATASIDPVEPGKAILRYQSQHVVSQIDLKLGIGPLPENRLARLPENFDIQDIFPGMDLTAARDILEEQGYSVFQMPQDPTIRAKDWNQSTLLYVKGDQFGSDQYPQFPDMITLVESTRFDLNPDAPETVVMIARTRSWGAVEGDGIAPDTLLNAIKGKYGAPEKGGRRNDYSITYNLAGERGDNRNRTNTQSCVNRSQAVQYQTPRIATGRIRLRLEPSSACGSTFRFSSDENGSVISAFTVVLYSDPLLINDVWRRYAGQIASKARATFEALDKQSGDDKKLDL